MSSDFPPMGTPEFDAMMKAGPEDTINFHELQKEIQERMRRERKQLDDSQLMLHQAKLEAHAEATQEQLEVGRVMLANSQPSSEIQKTINFIFNAEVSLGDVVIYTPVEGQMRAAHVVKVWGSDVVNLCVMNDYSEDTLRGETRPVYPALSVPYDEDGAVNTWRWDEDLL